MTTAESGGENSVTVGPPTRDAWKSGNPYVGPRPFAQVDAYRFFGRDPEAAELYSLVAAHRTVLLYAQSGAGKTSLLNAGLIPKLVQGGFDVLPMARVSGLSEQALGGHRVENIYVLNCVVEWAEDTVTTNVTLLDVLKNRPRRAGVDGEPLALVAIFDQFEELFTAYPQRWRDRRGFFEQLDDAMSADPSLRVLFAMREDFVAHIDPYEDLLPEEFRTRYRLEQLREDAALAAVERPLEETGIRFKPGVAKMLVDDLLKAPSSSAPHPASVETAAASEDPAGGAYIAGEFVEPVQLQVVCFSLFRNLPESTTEITPEHLEAFGDVDQALREFYQNSLKEAAEKANISEDSLRQWFESKLITEAGTRGLVFRGETATGGIPNPAVDALEDLHIIRAEVRGTDRWYELSHDRFVRPVLRANETWRALAQEAERRRLIEAERAEAERARLQAEQRAQKLRRLVRSLAWALGVMFLLALAAVYFVARPGMVCANVRDVAWSPVGKRLAAGCVNSTAIVWDEAGKQLLSLSGHSNGVSSIAWSPDGKQLATGSWDNTAKVWEAETGKELLTLSGHSKGVSSVAWSPDGKRLATGSGDKTAKVWDGETGKELLTLGGHSDTVWSVAWSPDGKRLATGSHDKTAKVWDAETGKELLILSGHSYSVNSVTWSPDGKGLATASDDTTAKVWDAESGKELLTLSGHSGRVSSVAWSPDGKQLATASWDKTAKVWDSGTAKELLTLRGHTDWLSSVTWSPDGKRLATGSVDDTVKVWDVGTGKELLTLRGRVPFLRALGHQL